MRATTVRWRAVVLGSAGVGLLALAITGSLGIDVVTVVVKRRRGADAAGAA